MNLPMKELIKAHMLLNYFIDIVLWSDPLKFCALMMCQAFLAVLLFLWIALLSQVSEGLCVRCCRQSVTADARGFGSNECYNKLHRHLNFFAGPLYEGISGE